MEGMDDFLGVRLEKYDRWISEGKIKQSSRVVPIGESLTAVQWILPSQQVLDLLKNAELLTVADCVCRSHYKRCDNPVDVCFILDKRAEELMEKGRARPISLEEAEERLQLANEHGLVHLALDNPDQTPFAVCSCCSCCCHDLQLLLSHGKEYLVARSEYRAVQDDGACIHCGLCEDRCVFGARAMDNGRLSYDLDRCYGCGLCATTCTVEAIEMKRV